MNSYEFRRRRWQCDCALPLPSAPANLHTGGEARPTSVIYGKIVQDNTTITRTDVYDYSLVAGFDGSVFYPVTQLGAPGPVANMTGNYYTVRGFPGQRCGECISPLFQI